MDFLIDGSLGAGVLAMLAVGLLLALGFECANGFHDTANAVATVIYTHALTPTQAVVWSGLWNFIGVLVSSGAVAFGIVALLPADLIVRIGSEAGFAMVFSLLVSAILWNVGTWYFGLPASSSHTLIGSIMGVGLTHSLVAGHGLADGVNWSKLGQTMLALLTSPVIGFVCAALLLWAVRLVLRDPVLHRPPEEGRPPPAAIRAVLVLTCTGVSFAHGSNDGQKGMGLIMLVLIGLAPAAFAVQLSMPTKQLRAIVERGHDVQPILAGAAGTTPPDDSTAQANLERFADNGRSDARTLPSLAVKNADILRLLASVDSLRRLSVAERSRLRSNVYLLDTAIDRLLRSDLVGDADAASLDEYRDRLMPVTDYIPLWVKVAVALALGLGTMVGWRRIVVTIGEKIGRAKLSYAQGASAELVTMSTIGLADLGGFPVSTTHILASGVAGAMFAGRSGLQAATLRNILLAWVLTVPACMLLGSLLFASSLFVTLRLFGA
ncbi:MAG TPA: inorganic phosphate transporter [Reyranella sp.]|nr:inorganic phosphate transporter [Reyranella sp.]